MPIPSDPTQPVRTYLEHPSRPHTLLGPGAADCHVHVFGPRDRFPYATGLKTIPLEAPKEALFALHAHLGIERCVIVQSTTHGMDNRVVEDAMDAGQGRYLGIALVDTDVAERELKRLADRGFRGVRFNFMKHLGASADIKDVIDLTGRLKTVGMHLQVHFESSLVHELTPWLRQSQVDVVIDHMGRIDATLGTDHEDFVGLLRLLDDRRFHVKLSGIDRIDARAAPDRRYRAGVNIARTLMQKFPLNCVWGTDWPHPNHTHIPDDGALVDALSEIAPTKELLHQLLVSNPQALYRFEGQD